MSFCQLCGHFSFQSAIYRLLLQLPSWAAPLGAWPLSIRRVPFLCGLGLGSVHSYPESRSFLSSRDAIWGCGRDHISVSPGSISLSPLRNNHHSLGFIQVSGCQDREIYALRLLCWIDKLDPFSDGYLAIDSLPQDPCCEPGKKSTNSIFLDTEVSRLSG